MSAEETLRRPTPAELVRDVAVAGLQRAPAPPEHTVGLTLNAKGDVQIEVTGRGPDLDEIAAHVAAKFDWLRAQYRPVNGGRIEDVRPDPREQDEAARYAGGTVEASEDAD